MRVKRHHVATLAVALVVGAGAMARVGVSVFDGAYRLHRRAETVFAKSRPFEARLSGARDWTVCAALAPASALPPAICDIHGIDPALTDGIVSLTTDMRDPAFESRPDAMWTGALVELETGRGRTEGLDVAIDRLGRVLAQDSVNAAARSDLAVAYLVRGAARPEVASLFLALDEIERAATMDSSSPLIAFNRALILERAHLYEEADAAWNAFLRLDGASGWATEARAHLDRLRQLASVAHFDGLSSRLAADVKRDPQGAREHILDELLPGWASARLHADEPTADSTARSVRAIAALLVAQGGDSSMLHVARALGSRQRDVEDAVRDFGEGARAFRAAAYVHAAPRLARSALTLRAHGEAAMAGWAEVLLSFVDIYDGKYVEATARSARVAREARARGDLALLGRALWADALAAIRQGGVARAHDKFTAASAIFARIGEQSNQGWTSSQVGDALVSLGRDDAALSAKFDALATFDARRSAAVRAGPLLSLGRQLTDMRMSDAGRALLREAVRSAPKTGRPSDLAEGLIRLARAEYAGGQEALARSRLGEARARVHALEDPLMRERMQMELDRAEASIGMDAGPRVALLHLERVLGSLRRRNILVGRESVLLQSAQLRLSVADTTGAHRDLTEAVAAVESLSVSPADQTARRDRAAARRDVYHQLVELDVALHDTVGAFLLAESSRGNGIAAVPSVRNGELHLSYSSLANRTLLWIIGPAGLRMRQIDVGAAQLGDLVERAESSIRAGNQAAVDSETRVLSDLLLAPAARELSMARSLVIVPDGPLYRLPFAVLRDSSRHFLVERLPLIYASAVRERPLRVRRSSDPIVIGNPAFDRSLFPGLEPLVAASREVQDVRSAYRHSSALEGPMATKEAIVRALAGATVFHFAGHARLVPRVPPASHLVLAHAPGSLDANSLSGADIAGLDLRRLALVILSSCGTTQGRSRRDDGESGLAMAFLEAGARAVISSLWEADDEGTARLMGVVHHRLASGDAPEEALRQAQLEMIRTGSAATSPRIWSTFRLTEH